jgi:hypothetical protein
MDTPKRPTAYFQADVHRALRMKAALAEDAVDLAAFAKRKKEKSSSFDSFARGLKRRGRI